MTQFDGFEKKRIPIKSTVSKGVISASILASSVLLPQLPINLSNQTVVNAASVAYTVTATNLNVRSGAGTNYSRIGSLRQGSAVQVIQKLSNGWYKISYNGKTGYVSGQYIRVTSSSSSPSPVYRLNTNGLNVRSGPGVQYSKLGLLKNGSVLNVIHKETNGWYKINFNGRTGYVSGQYVTTGSPVKTPASRILNVPLIAQRPELPSGCEVTSLAMALAYYGVHVNKTTLAKQMRYDSTKLVRNTNGTIRTWGDPDVGFVGTPFGNGYTINPAPLKRLLDRYRPGGVNLTGRDFSSVEQYILQGKPVLAWFTINFKMPSARYWKTPGGKSIYTPTPLHCIVVTGVDANYVYFNDSEVVKENVKISKSTFINIYNAMGKRALAVN
ncbi:SH3 domain-containing protein [Neobacillus terrae]|uniref:SH3 domain-containing protein n=1 Tax=Neobacillus terrae TaxID=3034837 RepID=UPI00140A6EAC|nr:SH3 domain-containing protein [Neobacillus terrae]NHM33273.1 SH3 domain-containing protein [Neobacillus terrae]